MVETRVFTSKDDMRRYSRMMRAKGKTVAFIPTMGYLHDGHLSLVNVAQQHADTVVVSIYVNPTQFAANEDFGAYPRNDEADMQKLRAHGVHAVFKPTTLYESGGADTALVVGVTGSVNPNAHETFVTVERLQRGMCGISRPHFFRGVATVVLKLFHIVEPDVAVFGKKDFQQLRVVQRMVRDLDMAITVIGGEIGREEDGLAMSSRNALLTAENRARAPVIQAALLWAAARLGGGHCEAEEVTAEVTRRIAAGGGNVDYVEVRDLDNLGPVHGVVEQPVLVAVAAVFGTVRLIDNIEIKVSKAIIG